MFKKFFGAMAIAAAVGSLSIALPAHANVVVINPTGATAGTNDLKIEVDAGSFLVTRNGTTQNFVTIGQTYNGILLSINTGNGIRAYNTPEYDNARFSSFYPMGQIGTDVLSNGDMTVTSVFYADVDSVDTDEASIGAYDAATDVKLTVVFDYVAGDSYFLATYTVEQPSGASYPIQLYHGLDMYLDGSDTGPSITGTGIGRFPGRYVLQEGYSGSVGGFIEADNEYDSYYADDFDCVASSSPSCSSFTTGFRGAFFAEPLPSFVNPDPSTDVGVGLHYDLGNTGAGTSIIRNSYIIFAASLSAVQETAPAELIYEGPILSKFSTRTLDVCKPTSVTIAGTRLAGITGSVNGVPVNVISTTDTSAVIEVPAGLTPGNKINLVVNSSYGTLTFQNAFDIPAATCAADLSKGRWTQLQSDGKTVKIYAKDPIGDGKIQFFKDGKEIAWINAVDESDPKLSFASGYPYLVRSVVLNEGKNRFEIKLDGVRVWRATYVPKV